MEWGTVFNCVWVCLFTTYHCFNEEGCLAIVKKVLNEKSVFFYKIDLGNLLHMIPQDVCPAEFILDEVSMGGNVFYSKYFGAVMDREIREKAQILKETMEYQITVSDKDGCEDYDEIVEKLNNSQGLDSLSFEMKSEFLKLALVYIKGKKNKKPQNFLVFGQSTINLGITTKTEIVIFEKGLFVFKNGFYIKFFIRALLELSNLQRFHPVRVTTNRSFDSKTSKLFVERNRNHYLYIPVIGESVFFILRKSPIDLKVPQSGNSSKVRYMYLFLPLFNNTKITDRGCFTYHGTTLLEIKYNENIVLGLRNVDYEPELIAENYDNLRTKKLDKIINWLNSSVCSQSEMIAFGITKNGPLPIMRWNPLDRKKTPTIEVEECFGLPSIFPDNDIKIEMLLENLKKEYGKFTYNDVVRSLDRPLKLEFETGVSRHLAKAYSTFFGE